MNGKWSLLLYPERFRDTVLVRERDGQEESPCRVLKSHSDGSLDVVDEEGRTYNGVPSHLWRFTAETRTQMCNPNSVYSCENGLKYKICEEPGKGMGVKVHAQEFGSLV